jgi:ATP adenylyltransferase
MDQMWAPWRMAYILSEPVEGCVFCDAFASEDDARTLVVHREAHAFVIMNRYPYNGGHVMVIPARHVSSLEALPPEAWAALTDLLRRAVGIITRALKADGANVGMNLGLAGGAGIADHIHFHVVPRWSGDTNFMPVIGDVKVVSEALEATWAKLRDAFRAEEGVQG